jgi:hypothetical protein
MSTIYVGQRRIDADHFHPETAEEPAGQRRRRGQLEQIDYIAYACSREVVGHAIGRLTPGAFQALALAVAQARAAWVAEAMRMAAGGAGADDAAVAGLAGLRTRFEELREAYEGARRMVERGYLAYDAAAPT